MFTPLQTFIYTPPPINFKFLEIILPMSRVHPNQLERECSLNSIFGH